MSTSTAMPFRFWPLLGLFVVLYLSIFQVGDFLEAESTLEELRMLFTFHPFTLLLFTGLSFFSYALLSYFVLHRFYGRIPWWSVLLLLVAVVVFCMFMRAFWEEVVVQAITGKGNYNPDMSWNFYLRDQMLYALIFTPLGILFYFVQHSRFHEAERLKTEQLRVETELKYLRSQVNPHFLFNTLNNLYSLVHRSSPLALPAMEKLSALLRYSLYEKAELVPLLQEVTHLRDLIDLEEMRLDGALPTELEVGRFHQPWCLPPLLLVPFVENAFKHGDLRQSPLRLRLVEDADGRLCFTATNAVRRGVRSKDATGGIGLTNVRQRLRLLYGEGHELEIKETEGIFSIKLTITWATERRCKEGIKEQSKTKPLPAEDLLQTLFPKA